MEADTIPPPSPDSAPEWETSKENFQPLRGGRSAESLKDTTAILDDADVVERNRLFERRLSECDGDDPLSLWLDHVRWTRERFPGGGVRSRLVPLLERATRQLAGAARYASDPRYLRLWLSYADAVEDPSDVFPYLATNGVGLTQALFWLAWAAHLERTRAFARAADAYEEGLRAGAEPIERLRAAKESFEMRMAKRRERDAREARELAESGEGEVGRRGLAAGPVESGRRGLGGRRLGGVAPSRGSGGLGGALGSTGARAGGLGGLSARVRPRPAHPDANAPLDLGIFEDSREELEASTGLAAILRRGPLPFPQLEGKHEGGGRGKAAGGGGEAGGAGSSSGGESGGSPSSGGSAACRSRRPLGPSTASGRDATAAAHDPQPDGPRGWASGLPSVSAARKENSARATSWAGAALAARPAPAVARAPTLEIAADPEFFEGWGEGKGAEDRASAGRSEGESAAERLKRVLEEAKGGWAPGEAAQAPKETSGASVPKEAATTKPGPEQLAISEDVLRAPDGQERCPEEARAAHWLASRVCRATAASGEPHPQESPAPEAAALAMAGPRGQQGEGPAPEPSWLPAAGMNIDPPASHPALASEPTRAFLREPTMTLASASAFQAVNNMFQGSLAVEFGGGGGTHLDLPEPTATFSFNHAMGQVESMFMDGPRADAGRVHRAAGSGADPDDETPNVVFVGDDGIDLGGAVLDADFRRGLSPVPPRDIEGSDVLAAPDDERGDREEGFEIREDTRYGPGAFEIREDTRYGPGAFEIREDTRYGPDGFEIREDTRYGLGTFDVEGDAPAEDTVENPPSAAHTSPPDQENGPAHGRRLGGGLGVTGSRGRGLGAARGLGAPRELGGGLAARPATDAPYSGDPTVGGRGEAGVGPVARRGLGPRPA